MKKIVLTCAILILLIAAISIAAKKKATAPTTTVPEVTQRAERVCFTYDQEAVPDAPYEVHETIDITLQDGLISGTKRGTQAGPDMTNGYEGTLAGTAKGDAFNLLFSYKIEGARQAEQERYTRTAQSLIKHRYPLIEKDGILIPDTTKDFRDIVYTETSCKAS